MAIEIDLDVCNKAKTAMVEVYNNHQLDSNYGCYSKAIKADVFCTVACTF